VGFASGLGKELGDHGSLLLDFSAFLLEGVLHVGYLVGEFCWPHLVELLNSFGELFEISRAFDMLRTAILEISLESLLRVLILKQHGHLVLVDMTNFILLDGDFGTGLSVLTHKYQ